MGARDLGVVIGRLPAGPNDAITDVAGVRVGHATLIEGDGPLVVGQGPVRTGVTVVLPRGDDPVEPVFAGCHRLNGNGELTGLEWIREAGILAGPVALTNTHSVGIVRDALVAASVGEHEPDEDWWSLPVVGETWDGLLNDINGFHVRAEHVSSALADARSGPVSQGNVGAGTGIVCHEFKGGIGTASRVLDRRFGAFTVGVLVQANHGRREWLRIDGVPVGDEIPSSEVPSPYDHQRPRTKRTGVARGSGSIIAVVATDAPLLPHQCERLAQRAGLGIARAGGTGGHSSGDLFLAFATGNRLPRSRELAEGQFDRRPTTYSAEWVNDLVIDELFGATVEATEAAIVNALLAAETMTGRDGITAHALPHARLLELLGRYRRGPRPTPT
ncbi:MAG: P1 family peptidase [Chloroflexota bacterium]